MNTFQPTKLPSIIRNFASRYVLTNREAEIVGLIALRGYSNKEIADYCIISEKTVKVHIEKIMDKVGTRSMRKLLSAIISNDTSMVK
ncbi:response regulator transcription factor [Paenibacillus roseipurpureus]|uniref:Helix-turn-helix transcriptional regulator n=1 Tax=Paenibacillus roseopurpureus TaxID=2918901 RepID=A0AA96RJ34_9BACL|nr:helix-turn-helix transcriptional regulator [Paenibacillus sp. MBLB1832]WNR44958.1 helix-turn-helix transcriptional regulator [Paenibacillus sp. MBLB1832]